MRQHQGIISRRVAVAFLLPALLFILVFLVFPSLWIFYLSLTNRTLTGRTATHPEFVGLGNYLRLLRPPLFASGQFGRSLELTLQFVLGSALLGQAALGLLLAWVFYQRKGFLKDLVYTLAILAWIIPSVVVAFLWVAFLDRDFGSLNALLSNLGLKPIDWLLDAPMVSIILFNTWRGAAFSMMLFSSALSIVPPSYLETADVVGASTWSKFKDIIFPLIRGHLLTDLILISLWTFNLFTPFLLTGGGPAFRTEILAIYTYRHAFRDFRFGFGAAISVVVMLINLILSSIYLMALRRREARV
ncbi:MAG: sugar ABC transporter permease [Deinococcus sp.]|nr:sugar ABC transporter permease [Deinococcus sp.]